VTITAGTITETGTIIDSNSKALPYNSASTADTHFVMQSLWQNGLSDEIICAAHLLPKHYATCHEYGRIGNEFIIQLPEYTLFMKQR
jgi:hypothetical protein